MNISKTQLYCAYNSNVYASNCGEQNKITKHCTQSKAQQVSFGDDILILRGFAPSLLSSWSVVKDSFKAFFETMRDGFSPSNSD